MGCSFERLHRLRATWLGVGVGLGFGFGFGEVTQAARHLVRGRVRSRVRVRVRRGCTGCAPPG
eukprot:scaffold97895_cov44-Phaeocystis_antarctica.AAC.2